jgi:4-diphosphocytidyl-2-C-methyl-D-erythritol kinase
MSFAALQPHSISTRRSVAANAPAKINLLLEVLGQRPDGFHEIRSLAIGVGLYDRLICSWPNSVGLTLTSSDPTLHSDNNLASRAALMLARRAGCDPQVAIDLDKRIPIGAGLGGGSSDAATTLRLCNELWSAGVTDLEMGQIGAELGSDVPLFFHLPTVEMSGRGECATPFPLCWSGVVLLVFPGIHVSTADVYEAWRKEDIAASDNVSFEELRGISRADELHDRIYNQLEPAVYRVCPRVKQTQDAIVYLGLLPTRVTGSGSALFRLYDDEDRARQAARTIQQNISGIRVEVVAGPVAAPALEHKES